MTCASGSFSSGSRGRLAQPAAISAWFRLPRVRAWCDGRATRIPPIVRTAWRSARTPGCRRDRFVDNVHCTVLRAMLNEAVPAGNSIDMSSPFVDAKFAC